MTTEVVINVNEAEWGEQEPEFLSVYKAIDFPLFSELKKSFDRGDESLGEELKGKITAHLEAYKEKNSEDAKNLHNSTFKIERILAIALDAEEGQFRTKVEEAINDREKAIEESHTKDIEREGMLIDGSKGVELVRDKDIEQQLSGLTGEQRGFVTSMVTQGMLGDCGSTSLSKLEQGILSPSKDIEKDIYYSLSVRNGRKILISSRAFEVMGLDMDMTDETIERKKIQATMCFDITDLNGDEFEHGKASSRVEMKVGYKSIRGDNTKILESIKGMVANPEKGLDAKGSFKILVEHERKEIGGFQSMEIRRQNAEAELNTSEKWNQRKKGLSEVEEIKQNAQIYGEVIQDEQTKMEYAARQIVKYANSEKPKPDVIKDILTSLLPKEHQAEIDKNANVILRAAQSSKGKGIPFRIMQVIDKIQLYVMRKKNVSSFVDKLKNVKKQVSKSVAIQKTK